MTKPPMATRDELQALAAIEKRMAGEPFTYGELCKIALQLGVDESRGRLCDKTIQRWRRRGHIWHWRDGKNVLWSLTDDGRAFLSAKIAEGE